MNKIKFQLINKKERLGKKYSADNLTLDYYYYSLWFEEFVDLPPMQTLQCDEEEVKELKGLKILTPNKLLTRLPVLLAQIKSGDNSYKLKKQN